MTTARSAIQGTPTQKWVSGRTYGLDAIVWSPISKLTYVRIVAGAGTTDPSADGTNWALWGPTKLKSVQRGITTVNAGSFSASSTVTAVDVAKSRLRLLGSGPSLTWGNNTTYGCRLSLSSSTAVSVELPQALAGSYQVSWELEEEW